jgi:hypothetical protein
MKGVGVARLALLFVSCLALLEMTACGGKHSGGSDQGPDSAASTPIVASTPIPTASGPPGIKTTISGSCRITSTGAVITVDYAATAVGSTVLTRVRLLQDGQEAEDSGPLQQEQYHRVATFDVQPGEGHTYRVVAESTTGPGPNVQSTVRCPGQPTVRPGPRA